MQESVKEPKKQKKERERGKKSEKDACMECQSIKLLAGSTGQGTCQGFTSLVF